ncbi:signal peptidase I [Nocardia sp. CDC153]|uniref:signal peptidase I n=1 Tax=Nocardia sp. CDC153 TaxID=3112167 RepID=UPI002DBA3ABA|nr:signal peptidase I [Nocardia sp. CDC153]MEC3954433.1 signal peptidase I [Nocardia sp. CDC153]
MADESESVTMSGSGDDNGAEIHGTPETPQPKPKKKQRPFWQELPILVGFAALIVALLVTFIGRPYVIPSQSMEPTLHGCAGCTGDRIYVEKLSYYFGDPEPGDVVVFVGPTNSWNNHYKSIRSSNTVVRGVQNFLSFFGLVPPDENDLVKRVIATGGQSVKCCDAQGRILVKDNTPGSDWKPLDEPYVKFNNPFDPAHPDVQFNAGGRAFPEVKVPDGNLWVMGDNRAESADSRYHMTDELQGTVPVKDVRGKAVFKIWPPSRIGPVRAVDPQTN